jgi:hypothetical protein
MTDVSQAPGWWLASDGKWYAPEQHPDYRPPPPPQPSSNVVAPLPAEGVFATHPPNAQVSPANKDAPPEDEKRKSSPLFRQWWFWAICGAVLLIAVAALIVGSEGTPPSRKVQGARLDATAVVDRLASRGLPVTLTVTYTFGSDPNHLLGRPNGYLSKASFTDSRIQSASVRDPSLGSVDLGGSVEVFASPDIASTRAAYLQRVENAATFLGSEYDFVAGDILVRVSGDLTAKQANEYKSTLIAIATNSPRKVPKAQTPNASGNTGTVTIPAAPTTIVTVPPTTVPATQLGGSLDLSDSSGATIRVLLSQLVNPAQSADQFTTPDVGSHFVAAVMTITNTSGSAITDFYPDGDTTVIGSDNQSYTSTFDTVSECADFNDGSGLAPGESTTGCVAFQIPNNVGVSEVKYGSPLFGSANDFGVWNISP